MLSSIGQAEIIISGKDYSLQTLGAKNFPIFCLHALKTNTGKVTMELIDGTVLQDLPPGTFQAGALYPYYIKRMSWNGTDAAFIGGRLIGKQ